ncbi:HAD family hydrolase [Paractinoplanes deccanensis]|uniref:HAD family hydrolase n=1 Tax=Paractinoplanes deccanensis TaxID=113561 RepID=UPI001EF3A9CA|nr:HAD family hydrolase [Actinoplanes deccanensis]
MLFDLDDTLVDQEAASRGAVVAWAAELGAGGGDGRGGDGRGGGDEVAARWARISERHYARYQRREIGFAEQRRERVREFLGVALDEGEADRLFAGYLARYEDGWVVFDDAVPALRRAREAGLVVAVLTNGEEGQQRRKLDRLGLLSEVDLLVASSSLPAGKPDRRAFRHAVGRMGVGAGEVLMVGDSLHKDVLGARAAGLEAVLLDRADVHAGAGVPRIRSLDDLAFAG